MAPTRRWCTFTHSPSQESRGVQALYGHGLFSRAACPRTGPLRPAGSAFAHARSLALALLPSGRPSIHPGHLSWVNRSQFWSHLLPLGEARSTSIARALLQLGAVPGRWSTDFEGMLIWWSPYLSGLIDGLTRARARRRPPWRKFGETSHLESPFGRRIQTAPETLTRLSAAMAGVSRASEPRSGRRGRRFKSGYPDQRNTSSGSVFRQGSPALTVSRAARPAMKSAAERRSSVGVLRLGQLVEGRRRRARPIRSDI